MTPQKVSFQIPFDLIRDLFWIILLPASWIWALGSYIRTKIEKRPFRTNGKVVCVGNIHVGGSGKTPLLIEIYKHFTNQKCSIVASGYRGKVNSGSVKLERSRNNGASYYGDEPWLMSQAIDSDFWVGPDRISGLKQIHGGIILMDDGLQNPSFIKDVKICTVSVTRDPDSRDFLPLGDLRSGLFAIHECDAVVVTGSQEDKFIPWKNFLENHFPVPVFFAKRMLGSLFDGSSRVDRLSEPVLAFCGIGVSAPFFSDVTALAPRVAGTCTFPNHMRYDERHARRLVELAAQWGVRHLVTTQKDWYKIEPYFRKSQLRLMSLQISYQLPNEFWSLLDRKVS